MTQSARSIEHALLMAPPHQLLLLRLNWPGQPLGSYSDGLITLERDGGVVGMNRAAAHILDASGNVMEAARMLGISRATVYRKLKRKP